MIIIVSVVVRLFYILLVEVLVDVKYGDYIYFELIIVIVMFDNGCFGIGYIYIGGKGGYVIVVMIEYDLVLMLIGRFVEEVELFYEEM